MKVLHVCTDYAINPLYGNLITALDNKGISNEVVSPFCIGREWNSDLIDSRTEVLPCYTKWDRFFYKVKQKKICGAIDQKYDINKFDVIHAHFLFAGGYFAYRCKQKMGIPYIVTIQNTDLNFYFKYFYNLRKIALDIILNADRIIFLTDAYKQQLITKYIPPEYQSQVNQKVSTIPLGIDPIWFRSADPHHLTPNTLNVVTTGVIDRNKNQLAVAQACDILERQGYSVIYSIVGPIADKSLEHKLISFPFVRLKGKMSFEELIAFYKTQDIFVMASKYESFGLVYAEAMSQGLPLVYTAGQGFDLQFPDGTVGYSTIFNDKRKIAECIIRNVEKYVEISRACIEHRMQFNWDNISAKYLQLYSDCLL